MSFLRLVLVQVSILLVAIVSSTSASTRKCKIDIKSGMHKTHPPMVINLKNTPEFVYPDLTDPKNLIFVKGEEATIFCPGKINGKASIMTTPGVILINDQELESSSDLVTIKCVGNNEFELEDRKVTFDKLNCRMLGGSSYGAIIRDTATTCVNGDRYEIGYDLGDNGFLKTIDICHNEKQAKTVWAHGVIEPINQIPYRHSGKRQSSFKIGSLYADMSMSKNNPYSLSKAFQTLSTLLGGDDEMASKYLSPKFGDRKFLAKGHLIANADKFYKSEQDSTFFLPNVVPMFQSINAPPGNWYFVEDYIRRLANVKKRKLDVWVGGLGVLKLEDTSIHLYVKNETLADDAIVLDERIPVPKILYKCVVNKRDQEGLCFLVVNNPYLTKTEVEDNADEFVVCRRHKSCDEVNADQATEGRGYMYCCGLKDFYTKNRKEAGLEDMKPFVGYRAMSL